MRAFVALDLPAPVRAQLQETAQALRAVADVRLVRPEHLHVTLQFLGQIEPAQADAIGERIARGPWPALSLRLCGLGQFPERGAPRVLWAGLAGDVEQLAALAERLAAATAATGIAREDRPFTAHVTLGRCRSPRGSARLAAVLRERSPALAGLPWQPAGIALYRSDPGAGGPVYRELARGALAG